MVGKFAQLLSVGGKSNSLGRSSEVVETVLNDKYQLDELYSCLFDDNEWVRMRAGDALEKVCRVHPEWLKPYSARLIDRVSAIKQPSVQWHLAQMLGEIDLNPVEAKKASILMKQNLGNKSVDWIVASYSMETLAKFARDKVIEPNEVIPLLLIQQAHHSKAVVKRATRLLGEFS